MSLTKTQYRDYILSNADDRQRQAIGHRYGQTPFIAMLERILAEYGLAVQLEAARLESRPKLKMLDVGCGEGLYLHDLAELLEKGDLRKTANLYGIDIHLPSIEAANEYSQLSNPPRPYLNFYVHDLRQPLQEQVGLFMDGLPHFDFIYARQVLGLLPQARHNVQRLYQALAPGGVIYMDDLIRKEEGWVLPHPALAPLHHPANTTLLSLNAGIDVATMSAQWLQEAGATMVQALPYKMVIGGETRVGMDALRSLLMWLRLVSLHLIEQGRLRQTQLNQLMDQLYQELSPQCYGYAIFVHTLARKPLA